MRLDDRQVHELRFRLTRQDPFLGRGPQVVCAVGQVLAHEIAVLVEAAAKAPLGRHVAVRREEPRTEACLLEDFGSNGELGVDLRLVLGGLVHIGIDPGQHRCLRRQRPRARHLRPRETGGVGGEGVVVRRDHVGLGVVDMNLVGAKRVAHPHVDMLVAVLGRRWRDRARNEQARLGPDDATPV